VWYLTGDRESDLEVVEKLGTVFSLPSQDNVFSEWKSTLEHLLTDRALYESVSQQSYDTAQCYLNSLDTGMYEKLLLQHAPPATTATTQPEMSTQKMTALEIGKLSQLVPPLAVPQKRRL
jgi:hypothetical protein